MTYISIGICCVNLCISIDTLFEFMSKIGVRGYPYGIFDPWVRWRSGSGLAEKFFSARRRRRRRPWPGMEMEMEMERWRDG